jgi:hypothetical protein
MSFCQAYQCCAEGNIPRVNSLNMSADVFHAEVWHEALQDTPCENNFLLDAPTMLDGERADTPTRSSRIGSFWDIHFQNRSDILERCRRLSLSLSEDVSCAAHVVIVGRGRPEASKEPARANLPH